MRKKVELNQTVNIDSRETDLVHDTRADQKRFFKYRELMNTTVDDFL